jgi:hypothetical protein
VHASVKKSFFKKNPREALTQVASHEIFHAKYTRARVWAIELVTSSLACSFLTISPTQHI